MSFVGLYTGLTGLRAAQTGIDVASHNVANANTPGYTRQRLELAARPTYPAAAGHIGTGVDVKDIARLRDAFLDDRFRAAVGDEQAASVRADLLDRMEALTGEPEQGLSTALGRLWEAAETWANDPADPATRRQVMTELAAIAEGFRTTAGAWDALADDTAARRGTVLDQTNRTLETLHDLDRRIANADPSRIGPDLLDQRDELLDELAELTGASARIGPDGRAQVVLGGVDLIDADGPATLAIDGDDVVATPAGGGPVVVTASLRGELGGLHRFLTEDLPSWQTALDELATAFAAEVNAVNQAGVTADGSPGEALLAADDPDAPARTLALLTDELAALAAAEPPDGGGEPSPHDGSNARHLADLRLGSFVDPDGPKLEARLADLTVGLAGEVRAARVGADAARATATGAALSRAAQHGVSLDEEMVDLVRYQRALEAASRVMTTVDEALDVLVNRTGIVGR